MNQLRQIKSWLEKVAPNSTPDSVHVVLSSHLQGTNKLLGALSDAGEAYSTREQLNFTISVLNHVQRQLVAHKEGAQINLADLNRRETLSALCEQIVTAVTIGHMLEMDIEGALQEVAASNDSKLASDGQPIFSTQMKIVKGPGYFEPDLNKYIGVWSYD